jgi:hypothetical protein
LNERMVTLIQQAEKGEQQGISGEALLQLLR